ncbi:FAD-binding monooxygenase ktnD [Fulvia fulva]|nr:FAD-binding monooxygenase ktnD [Fulvia fulva]KAK4609921.1 FAD-binding monooxygenase ktnD [Fulvia fulva]WPV37476.1 FAD-binding monooxygenase ktnD [Fulvia fulva]
MATTHEAAATIDVVIIDVVIIGARISGMTLAIDLIRLGHGRSFLIIEKGHRIGGTWFDTFAPNPDWSRECPTQPEIQRYLTGTQTIGLRFVVSAVGQLKLPKYPKIPGIEDFAGLDLRGKRVAVIGNGATAIQIVPELAKTAKSLVVFQRSPNWVTPRDDSTISAWRQSMDIREAYWSVLVDTDGETHQTLKSIASQQLNTQLPGDERSELRKVLTPNYPPGCKRILISDDYYPALGKPHVTLKTAAIEKITDEGIRASTGWNSAKVDGIIYATGFQATQFLSPIHIGVSGQDTLAERWTKGAYAFKGIMVPKLPNFAIMYGPNTDLGHSARGYLRITPRESATKAWNDKLQASLGRSTLASDQCSSWYKSDNGLIATNWSETVVDYQLEVSTIDWSEYEMQGPGASDLRAKGRVSWSRVVEESQPWFSSWTSVISIGLPVRVLAAATLLSSRRLQTLILPG